MQRFDQPLEVLFPPVTGQRENMSLAKKWIPEWCVIISELLTTIEFWLAPLQTSGKLRARRNGKVVNDPVLQESYLIDHMDIFLTESQCLSLVPVSALHGKQPGRVAFNGLKQEVVLLSKPNMLSDTASWFLLFDESDPKIRTETQLSHGMFYTLLTKQLR